MLLLKILEPQEFVAQHEILLSENKHDFKAIRDRSQNCPSLISMFSQSDIRTLKTLSFSPRLSIKSFDIQDLSNLLFRTLSHHIIYDAGVAGIIDCCCRRADVCPGPFCHRTLRVDLHAPPAGVQTRICRRSAKSQF